MEEMSMNYSVGNGSGWCMDTYSLVDMCSWTFVLMTVVLGLIIVAIILGNSLVITAVFLYRKLRKSVSNGYIASLALADLVLAILVLPFSASYEIMGYWVFGQVMCRIWLVVDVWVCTASILHLCMISIDRYIAIAFPLKYPFLMTHRRCRIICVGLWLLAFAICFPALINFSVAPNSTAESSQNETNIRPSIDHVEAKPEQCDVLEYPLAYTIYSAMGSFFIPSMVMSGFYIRIFLLTHKYLKQAKAGAIEPSRSSGGSAMRIHRGGKGGVSNPSACNSPVSHVPDSNGNDINCNSNNDGHISLKTRTDQDACTHHEVDLISRESSIVSRITHDQQQTHQLLPNQRSSRTIAKSIMINRETKAAKTVAIIVGCFIACWTPFFICYLKQGITGQNINVHLFRFFIWVGYVNSLINPCIYAFFSNDYRHAFKKILRCQVRRMKSKNAGVSRYFNSLYVSSSGRTATVADKSRCSTHNNAQKLNTSVSDEHHSAV